MKILFCNIAWLDYYKGIYEGVDEPVGGGDYVKKTRDAHEKYNFEAIEIYGDEDKYCLGYVEVKGTKTSPGQLHIEKINGCEDMAGADSVDDVLVVYCAKHPAHNFTTVVGWYEHATVYRYYQEMHFSSDNPDEADVYVQHYNAIAKADDCVLLPRRERSLYSKWSIPRRTAGAAYGFGQSNIWYANEDNELLKKFLEQFTKRINEYDGENWLYKYPEIS
ncbi:MAG: hypothetical protein GX059_04105 [Clostridiales bacterium]|jgi:hypothetical protein|nr:hypothetical protein [Clostridiales bacterium]